MRSFTHEPALQAVRDGLADLEHAGVDHVRTRDMREILDRLFAGDTASLYECGSNLSRIARACENKRRLEAQR